MSGTTPPEAAPEADAPDSPPERAATFREVFEVREFRPLFGTFLLSTIGDELARVALAVLVYQRTSSPLLSALTFAMSYLPWLLGGPVLATLADRLPRHRVLIATDVARAVLVGLMAVPGMPLPALLLLLLLVSVCAPPFEAARSALMADVLEGDRYILGNTLTNISLQVAQVAGFLLAGLLVAVDPSLALLVDALTFAVSALWLWARLERRPAPQGAGTRGSVLRDAGEGIRLIRRTPRLLAVIAVLWVGTLFANAWEGLAAPLADELGRGAVAVGVLLAANPLGVSLGGVVLARLVTPRMRERLVPLLVVLTLVALLLAGLVTATTAPGKGAFAVVVGLLFLSGIAGAWFIPLNSSFVQAVPSAFRGRAFGVAVSGLYGVQGIGVLAAGLAAEGVAASSVVALSGGLGLLAVVLPLVAYRRTQGHVATGPGAGGPSEA